MSSVSSDGQVSRATKRHPLIGRVFDLARAAGVTVYLVGGTVRDLMLGIAAHDLDFAVDGDGLSLARRVADRLRGAYVALDRERGTGRVVLPSGQASPADTSVLYLDFAALRGPDLEADLRDRDFTFNAMAIAQDASGALKFIDPLQGARDLAERVVRATSSSSLARDPVRTLRALRLQAQLGCTIETQTRTWIEAAVPAIATTSPERTRDEWFKILEQSAASDVLDELHRLGLLRRIAPPLANLEGLAHPNSQGHDALAHAFETVRAVEGLWDTLCAGAQRVVLAPTDLLPHILPNLCARYRSAICDERTYLGLLKCAALLHDVGRSQPSSADREQERPSGGHEREGGRIAASLARDWRCSNAETGMLRTAVEAHAHPVLLSGQLPLSRRAIYRYYRDTGVHGLDAAFLALAHYLAAWGPVPPQEGWQRQVLTATTLWHTYLEQRETVVDPPPLLSGNDLIRLGLSPGPQIGTLLSRLHEEQAAGEIRTYKQALAFVQEWQNSSNQA